MVGQCDRKTVTGLKINYFNYIGECIHTYVVSEKKPFSTKTPRFFCKNSTFTQSNSIRVALEIF